jgi:Mn2+/Fe2+ NRAMP family transporter
MSIENEKKFLKEAESKGLYSCLAAYTKLSGPGWLQSAITLGGGSLASSLFLGVLAGYSLLWLQPIAIILGIIMLSAISHVTLSTGQSPFVSINKEINPVLGWGWAIATIMANIVWCLPQFSLGTAAVTQNLAPSLNNTGGKVGICFKNNGGSSCNLVFWGSYQNGNRWSITMG